MLTFDAQTIDSAGVFLIQELERLDQTLHMPLASVTWGRDIDLREDVSIADELSSFTNSSFAAAGGPSPNGKSWIGKNATEIGGISLDIGKTASPMTIWGMNLDWTIIELQAAQQLGRPVDAQKMAGMQLKWQMDTDEQVYIGDSSIVDSAGNALTGLVNAPSTKVATITNAATGLWNGGTTTPDQILNDINTGLQLAWAASGYAICPTECRLPPVQFGYLVGTKISSAGNISVLEYIKQNSICNSINGRPLNIQPLKWLKDRGAGSTQRMMLYTKDPMRVRFPMVPLQRTPLEYRGLYQSTTYYGRLGAVEIPYGETMAYIDGI